MTKLLKFAAKRRLNYIDCVDLGVTLALIYSGKYLAAALVTICGSLLSVLVETKLEKENK